MLALTQSTDETSHLAVLQVLTSSTSTNVNL